MLGRGRVNISVSTVLAKNPAYSATVLPDGSWILFHSGTSDTVVVTAPAGILWELCNGADPLSAVLGELHRLYPDQSPAVLLEDGSHLADELLRLGVIQMQDHIERLEKP
jgi:hypothetical protein